MPKGRGMFDTGVLEGLADVINDYVDGVTLEDLIQRVQENNFSI